jgi:hypothetical protein
MPVCSHVHRLPTATALSATLASCDPPNSVLDRIAHLVDVLILDRQRRGQRNDITSDADQQPTLDRW